MENAPIEDAPVSFDAVLARSLPVDEIVELKIRPLYALVRTRRALYEESLGRRDAALAVAALTRRIAPASAATAEVHGDLLAAEGRLDEALSAYADAFRSGGDAVRIAGKGRVVIERKERGSR
jgi:tetratricopeptide (TPR) repeat protein